MKKSGSKFVTGELFPEKPQDSAKIICSSKTVCEHKGVAFTNILKNIPLKVGIIKKAS
jgi:hypothetical protein